MTRYHTIETYRIIYITPLFSDYITQLKYSRGRGLAHGVGEAITADVRQYDMLRYTRYIIRQKHIVSYTSSHHNFPIMSYTTHEDGGLAHGVGEVIAADVPAPEDEVVRV